MMNNKEFYEAQKELIDIAQNILKDNMKALKTNPKYTELFYHKDIPPHILQPLMSVKNRIILKPIYWKIETELNISQFKAKKLVENHGFSFILNNLEKIKELLEKMPFSKVNRDIYILIK